MAGEFRERVENLRKADAERAARERETERLADLEALDRDSKSRAELGQLWEATGLVSRGLQAKGVETDSLVLSRAAVRKYSVKKGRLSNYSRFTSDIYEELVLSFVKKNSARAWYTGMEYSYSAQTKDYGSSWTSNSAFRAVLFLGEDGSMFAGRFNGLPSYPRIAEPVASAERGSLHLDGSFSSVENLENGLARLAINYNLDI